MANLPIDHLGCVHSTKEGGDIMGFVLMLFIGLVNGLDINLIEKPMPFMMPHVVTGTGIRTLFLRSGSRIQVFTNIIRQ